MSTDRIVLNPVSNVQNVISGKNLDDIIGMTCKQLTSQLLEISGPYAKNAFIMHDAVSLAASSSSVNLRKYGDGTKVFTRDGRKTLNSIEYASPAQRYIKEEIVTRIGEIIDNECSDGTTSSMIYVISFLMNMMKRRDELKNVSITDVEHVYERVMDEVLEHVRSDTITISDLLFTLQQHSGFKYDEDNFTEGFEESENFTEEDVRKIIGYIQAYTSSSGNKEIAEAVATVISKMPITTWGDEIMQEYSIAETKDGSVTAAVYDSEIIFDSISQSTHLNNLDRGTVFLAKDCHLLVLRESIVRESILSKAINTYVQTTIVTPERLRELQDAKYLVVIVPGFIENYDSQYVEQLFNPLVENGVKVYFTGYLRPRGHEATGYQWYRVDAIPAKADIDICDHISLDMQEEEHPEYTTVTPYIIKGATVHVDRYRTKVSNLIDWSKVSEEVKAICMETNTHPGEYHPELYPYYHSYQNFVIQQIDKYLSREGDPHEVTIKDLKDAHTLARCVQPWVIKITGKSRDQQMLQYIIDDAAGAAIQALRDGIQFNGPVKLVNAISNALKRSVNVGYTSEQMSIRQVLLLSMLKASMDMVFSMFGPHAVNVNISIDELINIAAHRYSYINIYTQGKLQTQIDVQPFSYMDNVNPKDMSWTYHDHSKNTSDNKDTDIPFIRFIKKYHFESEKHEHECVPPSQVGNLIPVLLDRVREVCLRFVCSSSIVAPRTIWDDGQLNK